MFLLSFIDVKWYLCSSQVYSSVSWWNPLSENITYCIVNIITLNLNFRRWKVKTTRYEKSTYFNLELNQCIWVDVSCHSKEISLIRSTVISLLGVRGRPQCDEWETKSGWNWNEFDCPIWKSLNNITEDWFQGTILTLNQQIPWQTFDEKSKTMDFQVNKSLIVHFHVLNNFTENK